MVWSPSASHPAVPKGTASAVAISSGLALAKLAVTMTRALEFVPEKKVLQAG